jgi:hypothetical protein
MRVAGPAGVVPHLETDLGEVALPSGRPRDVMPEDEGREDRVHVVVACRADDHLVRRQVRTAHAQRLYVVDVQRDDLGAVAAVDLTDSGRGHRSHLTIRVMRAEPRMAPVPAARVRPMALTLRPG